MTTWTSPDLMMSDDAVRSAPPLTRDDAAAGVLARVRTVVQSQPDSVAVADERSTLTYRQVAVSAAATLHAVRAADLPPGAPLALIHPHRAEAPAALLAVLASGHPVVMLDPRTPPARLRLFVEQAGAAAVLTHPDTAGTASEIAERVILTADDCAGPEDDLWADPPNPASPAALAFTSGSTGRPKVVINDHHMLVRDAWTNSAATGCYGPDDVVAHTLPLAFHAGLMVTVAGLLVGSRMELFDVRGNGIAALPTWVSRVGATVMHCSPAILRALLATGPDPALLAGLRSLTIAGESAHGRDVEAARAVLSGDCVIRNRYGSSETGLICEYPVAGDHPPLHGALPVGRPVGDTILAVVDDNGDDVPAGEPGVLTITSSSPASGYWNDPEATAAAFCDNADGTRTFRSKDVAVWTEAPSGSTDPVIKLLGRRDHSVKIRGYLVEPGEVDVELFALPEVVEAVTVAGERPGSTGNRLISYVVSTSEQPAAAGIRRALRERLPSHMVPEVVIFLTALPRTDRGKLDRSALPEPPALVGPESFGEMSDWEQVVADVWARALELDSVGPDQDFFELGGDSLAAEAVLAATVDELGVARDRVTATVLAEAPTVREFARQVRRDPDPLGAVLVPLNPVGEAGDDAPPIFFVAGGGGLGLAFVGLSRRLPDRAAYALQMHGMERRGLPDWTVRRAARRSIRALKTVQPHGPYVIAGHSYGGIVAFEMAHLLTEAGEQVQLLAILDSFPPDPKHHPAPEPRPLAVRIKAGLGLLATGWATTPGTGNYWRFFDLTSFIGRHHRSKPYAGDAVVMVADSEHRDLRSAWAGHLTGHWDLVEVPGDHLSMLREPHVSAVADVLTQRLGE